MRVRRVVSYLALIFAMGSIAFAFYLSQLYQQLGSSFVKQEQFVPTRIYSDVTRVVPGDSREKLEARLKSLGYSWESSGPEQIHWVLRAADYPEYLVPEGHPVLLAGEAPVVLNFEGALLKTIRLGESEVAELYLEPELVATLSRGGEPRAVRELLKWDDIPPMIWKAIIAVEDQHYLDHKGLDPRGIARAIWVNIKTRSFAQGGSTLTMQLVKNLMARREKDIFRKVNELFLALMLEARFSKEEILERYLNEVYLGQIGNLEVHGVAEGAKYFFGKSINELNLAEVALMAGLIRGPGYYSPYRYRERAMERQRLVLRKMVETGQVAEAEAQEAMEMPIRLAPPQMHANKAPYFVDFVKAELIRELKDRYTEQELTQAGLKVYTTLDLSINLSAQRAVATGVGELEKRMKLAGEDRLEGALAAVEQSSGYIRALVGGRSYAQSTFNRILNMKRQVGSTFKPVVYLTALRRGYDREGVPYSPAHPAEDAPWTLVFDRGLQEWAPKNYEKEFMGWTSYRKALAHSVNTIAARLGHELGTEALIDTARALGAETELPAVPALALGVAEMSPVELLKMYATMANHGEQPELTVVRGITLSDGTRLFRFVSHPRATIEPGPADLLTDMLQSVFAEGTARSARTMGFERPAAGKTGTTSDHRDSWFAGYTPELTAVVWVGMDQSSVGERKKEGKGKAAPLQLTGATSALPIWVAFMKEAVSGNAASAFPVSSYLTTFLADLKSGKQAYNDCPETQTAIEKFIIGFEPKTLSCEALWPASQNEANAP